MFQNNHNDDMAVELSNSNAQMQAMVSKHAEETKALRRKIDELQSTVDSVNQHIEDQVRELCDRDDDDENSVGTSSYYHRDSFGSPTFSRQSSFMDSPMVDRSVSFTLGPRRHLPDFLTTESVSPDRGYVNSTLTTPNAEHKIDHSADDADDYGDAQPVDLMSPIALLSNISPMKSALKSSAPSRAKQVAKESKSGAFSDCGEVDGDADDEECSPQFRRLYAAMQLLTTSMRHSIDEERILRTFTTGQQFHFMDQCQSDEATIRFLEDKQEYLEEKSSSQQDSLAYSKDQERRAVERAASVEEEFLQMRAQYLQSVRNEQVAIGNAAKFEQLYLDLHIQVDKVRKEKKQYMDAGMDSSAKCAELEAKMEDLQEARSVLESELQLAPDFPLVGGAQECVGLKAQGRAAAPPP